MYTSMCLPFHWFGKSLVRTPAGRSIPSDAICDNMPMMKEEMTKPPRLNFDPL